MFKSLIAALIFYTKIPFPYFKNLEFTRLARWSPIIGIIIGICLSLLDRFCHIINLPILLRSAMIVAAWVWITGGLHLDGVMDTADGLAVMDKPKRLAVMQDSVTGAYGVMAAMLVLILKWAALTELDTYRGLGICLAAGWGRWGQVMAIANYPYLKPTGKGAFHQKYLKIPQDILLGLIFLLGIRFLFNNVMISSVSILLGSAIALLTGFWFARQLGGHTGDSYGAVVEWTEAFFLCIFVVIVNH